MTEWESVWGPMSEREIAWRGRLYYEWRGKEGGTLGGWKALIMDWVTANLK